MMKKLTKAEFFELDYEEIDECFVKHDVTNYTFVYQDKDTGKWYMGNFNRSYNNGIEDWDFPIEVYEAEKVEVKTFQWRMVK